jgi:hypothetical protein
MSTSLKKTLPTSSVAVLKHHSHLTHICCLSICPTFLHTLLQCCAFINSRMYPKSWKIYIIITSKLSVNEIISCSTWLFKLEQYTLNPTPNMLLEVSLPNQPHCYNTLHKQTPMKFIYNSWYHLYYTAMFTISRCYIRHWCHHCERPNLLLQICGHNTVFWHSQFIISNTTVHIIHFNLSSDFMHVLRQK